MIITDSIIARDDVKKCKKIVQLSIAHLIGEAIEELLTTDQSRAFLHNTERGFMNEIVKINADKRTNRTSIQGNQEQIPKFQELYIYIKKTNSYILDEKSLKAQVSDSGFFQNNGNQLANESFKARKIFNFTQ